MRFVFLFTLLLTGDVGADVLAVGLGRGAAATTVVVAVRSGLAADATDRHELVVHGLATNAHHGAVGVPTRDHLLRVAHHGALSHVLVEHRSALRRVHLRLRHTHALLALRVLGLELGTTELLALGEGDVQWLAVEHVAVHGGHGLGGLLGGGEAHKAKALGLAGGVAHDAAGGDGTELGKLVAELLVQHLVAEVLDVQVDTGVLLLLLDLALLKLLAKLLLALLKITYTPNRRRKGREKERGEYRKGTEGGGGRGSTESPRRWTKYMMSVFDICFHYQYLYSVTVGKRHSACVRCQVLLFTGATLRCH